MSIIYEVTCSEWIEVALNRINLSLIRNERDGDLYVGELATGQQSYHLLR